MFCSNRQTCPLMVSRTVLINWFMFVFSWKVLKYLSCGAVLRTQSKVRNCSTYLRWNSTEGRGRLSSSRGAELRCNDWETISYFRLISRLTVFGSIVISRSRSRMSLASVENAVWTFDSCVYCESFEFYCQKIDCLEADSKTIQFIYGPATLDISFIFSYIFFQIKHLCKTLVL